MGQGQRIITTVLWGALVLVMVGVVVGQFWPSRHEALPVLFPAARFALTDQAGKPFGDGSLRGHPYIATFIFTRCAGSCPMMSSKLAQLQKLTPRGVQLVSFSVDPDFDKPAVLEKYGKNYGADDTRWHFLTGTPQQMLDVSADMKLTLRAADKDQPLMHSDKFLLVDGQGDVRGIYDSHDDLSIRKLADDAAALESDAHRTAIALNP